MDVIQHGVSVPNNRCVHELICNSLEIAFLFCCNLILLKPYPNADFFWVPYCFRSVKKINPVYPYPQPLVGY